ncbi:hypothetical protein GCM10020220_036400 [Nonomuraea rubra]
MHRCSLKHVIAFLGQGRMGAPMARRLVAAGHKVTTWRRSGGVPVATAVDGADLVITMLRRSGGGARGADGGAAGAAAGGDGGGDVHDRP